MIEAYLVRDTRNPDTYCWRVQCENCTATRDPRNVTIHIPRGQSVACERCGAMLS